LIGTIKESYPSSDPERLAGHVAVGGCGITPAAARLQVMLAHQSLDPLVVRDHALMAERGLHAAPAISFELIADHGDSSYQFGIADQLVGS
jgi:hypothetical protein